MLGAKIRDGINSYSSGYTPCTPLGPIDFRAANKAGALPSTGRTGRNRVRVSSCERNRVRVDSWPALQNDGEARGLTFAV